MSEDVATDEEVLARQYADDRNLRARQRLWRSLGPNLSWTSTGGLSN